MTELPDPEIKPARRSLLERVSVVWLVPIGALLISLAIAWQNYSSRGPLIEIAFADASGIRAGETEVRYRDVPVGVVEEMSFSDSLGSVLVSVRLDQDIAAYVDAESEFWVVRPRVTAQGVTGLSTVLSGVYIQGSWDNTPGGVADRFEGLDTAPVARPDVPGLQIVLSSPNGEGLLQGTPILYRGVQVGAVSGLRLADDGESVLAEAFVEAPHDRLITTSTRFWNASGFSFSLGPRGATLDVSSLAALVSGGVALENLVSGGEPAEPEARFELYPDRAEALSSVFVDPETANRVTIGFIFSGNVTGLAVGSAVEYQGLRIGEIAGVTGLIDEERFGDRNVRLLATAEIDPTRVVVRDAEDGEDPVELTPEDTLQIFDDLAADGVRAQLARGSILTGGLKIVLSDDVDAEPAGLDREDGPIPIFPTTSSEVPEVSDTVEGLIARVNDLPIEELLNGASTLLQNVNALVGSDAVRAAPEEVLGVITDVRGLVGSEEVQEIPGELGQILAALEGAVTDARDVLAEFREAGAATALTQALQESAPALETLNRILAAAEPAAAELPVLAERLGAAAEDVAATAATVANLPLADVVGAAAETAQAARDLVASQAVQQVPADVSAALEEVTATLQQVREAQLVANTSSAMTSAGDAAARLAQAAEDLPALIERIEAVAANIEALPLGPTLEAAERTLTSANALIASEDTQAVPAELNAALSELGGVLEEFRASGVLAQVNATLDETGQAAAAIRDATAEVPQVVASIEEFAQTVNALPLQELAADLAAAAEAAQQALTSANEILGSEGVRTLPAEINAVLAEVQSTLASVRTTGLVAQVNTAVSEAGQAAAAIREATAGVPQVVAGLDRLTQRADELPLERMAEEIADLAESADTLISTAGAQELPASLSAALDEVRAALQEMREGGLINSANQTLASTRDAAAAVEEASRSLPELAARLDALADQAERTLAGYDEGSELTREAQRTLREVTEAARTVSALARQIERNPNSLLLGR